MSVRGRAIKLGATDFTPSQRRDKKWAVFYHGRWIHFGAKGYDDYTQHHDKVRRASYRKRHAGILLKDGRPAYTVKESPAYWSWHVLW